MTLDERCLSHPCEPDDVALKSFFLGPRSENGAWFEELIIESLESWFRWRRSLFPEDGRAISASDQESAAFIARRQRFEEELRGLLERFEEEVPKYSPRYIAHMFSETSLPAMVGHIVTLLHNPNNISGESSRVGLQIETEAVAALGAMVGFAEGRGHFTSGGTVANFEAVHRARRRVDLWLAMGAAARSTLGSSEEAAAGLFEAAHMGWERYDGLLRRLEAHPGDLEAWTTLGGNLFERAAQLGEVFGQAYRGPVALIPENKHYSWKKAMTLFGLGQEAFWGVRLDAGGHLCVEHLRQRIEEARRQGRPILMVVSVAGTTELGDFDPVDDVQDLLDDYARTQGIHIWHHVDAAYGGFFCSLLRGARGASALGDDARRALEAIWRVESVTLDPHKLGYVPYASGAFLTRSLRDYALLGIDAPYLELQAADPGPQTLEGSRSAAGAVATWLTARSIGLDAEGYGRILERTIRCRQRFEALLENVHPDVRVCPTGESNILTFCIARPGEALSGTNERTRRIYQAFSPEQDGEFYVSKTSLRFGGYGALLEQFTSSWQAQRDTDELLLIRLCLMNPFIDSRETAVQFPEAFAASLGRVLEG
jgi:glutamate/tyrosine decarboxylase-like PLP-dependent enzyme